MPRRFRHALSLQRLTRSKALPWLARAVALLLILSNAFAVTASARMLAIPATSDMSAMHHAMGVMAATAESAVPTHSMGAMHHHLAVAADAASSGPVAHGSGCPCCDNGHCQCLQACNPLPQVAAALPAAWLPPSPAPAPMQVAATTSVVGAPPLRPPIA